MMMMMMIGLKEYGGSTKLLNTKERVLKEDPFRRSLTIGKARSSIVRYSI